MDKKIVQSLERRLRRLVSGFLKRRTADCQPLSDVLDNLSKEGCRAFLFGGALRDLMLFGSQQNPRDLDIVVSLISSNMKKMFNCFLNKRTHFGGFQLGIATWELDVWAISDTWAFREKNIEATFENLPKTTFLNIQAIAAELPSKNRQQRHIYSHGFFEAVLNKTVDINFEDNPYPTRCLFSSLLTAAKLRFSIAPRLAAYILHHAKGLDLAELVHYQQTRNGTVHYDEDVLHKWLVSIQDQHRSSPKRAVLLPISNMKQDKLPFACA